jgi:hypothetical protein
MLDNNIDTYLRSTLTNLPLIPLAVNHLKLLWTTWKSINAEEFSFAKLDSYDVYSPVFIISIVLDPTTTAGRSLGLAGHSIIPTWRESPTTFFRTVVVALLPQKG